ncbi:LVIVD repeat-containing protein [Chitinophaga pinensis]|uniref:LVIVD repeat-containing protein n=1 Tax=Chitinophaga pinensis (strain ATCC 43595 / DSM 2588 / LMG 13176 / NBRC 15968 / NCIMB 11800 / UQM 2034) TaxID=485918 RepID=A0A979GAX0_CHIPD|nr:hypothetical protein [Chitinophaga pinensis]ACU63850.1 hypothetical protein Cpin_6446 [Chitinophaga pinensis DSM 2588]
MARLLLTYVLLITCFLLGGCLDDRWERGYVDAYVPVYDNNPNLRQISYQPARAIRNAGKLYTYGTYILQEESDSGLHIISYQDPAHPVKTGFLRIPGFQKALIEGDYLYADNYNDLIVVPLKELPSVTHVARVSRVWTQKDFPPFRNVYFECPVPTKGTVIGWHLTKVNDPKCRTQFRYYDGYGEQRPRLSAGIVGNKGHIYLADNTDIVSYSVTQPLAPVQQSRYQTGEVMDSLYAFNDMLITTDVRGTGGSLYDISDPLIIQYRTMLTNLSSCYAMLPAGRHIYAAPNPAKRLCYPVSSTTLTVSDIEDDYRIVAKGALPFDSTYALALSGNYLYAATPKGISVVDVSSAPALTRLADKEAVPYIDLVIRGTQLYCRSNISIDCYDISSPAAIKVISKLVY